MMATNGTPLRPCELAEDLLLSLADVPMVVQAIHDEWMTAIKGEPDPHDCEMCTERMKVEGTP